MNKTKKYFIRFIGSLILVFPPFHELIHCIINIATGKTISYVNWWGYVDSGYDALYIVNNNLQLLDNILNGLWEFSVFIIVITFIMFVHAWYMEDKTKGLNTKTIFNQAYY